MRSMSLDKAGSSVIPSCACVLGEGLLFLGSRLGDSLLLNFSDTSLVAQADQVIFDISLPPSLVQTNRFSRLSPWR